MAACAPLTLGSYMARVCAIIAKHQITQGGAVVLFQPENEYSYGHNIPFPNGKYMQYVIDQARRAGIVVPMINNDVGPGGNYAPGSGVGQMDIYASLASSCIDEDYPLGFDCANPYTWPPNKLPTDFHQRHVRQSPQTPYSIIEFQGGSFDPWGGYGLEQCSVLVNHEFSRVFNKNNMAAGVTIFSLYMIFGGTNWGNLGHPGGYTSYDYGACIRENRVVDREKYSEVKLEGEFFKVSPGYLVATPGPLSTTVYSDNADITVTPLLGNGTGSFFVARHSDYASTASTSYKLKLPTSAGTITVPQSGGVLSLHGRDSKVHVVDYPVGDYSLLYSTAEIFTWKEFGDRTVLVMYGGPDETHEFAFKGDGHVSRVEGDNYSMQTMDNLTVVVQWKTSPERQVVQIGDLAVYMVDRNSAYNYWVPVLPKDGSAYGSSLMNPAAVIVNGGYLVRSASVDGSTLSLQADFNATTSLEVIGAPKGVSRLRVNGKTLPHTTSPLGNWISKPDVRIPDIAVPDLSDLEWHQVDSLPEVQPDYDDAAWPVADHATTNNTAAPLKTPVSLYGADYGFNTGTLVFRGHFTARGVETQLRLWTKGGSAYASSVWLNGTFLGSFNNARADEDNNSTYPLSGTLRSGARYVVTVVVDSTGLDENFNSGFDNMKSPRGIIDYALLSANGSATATPISPWKLTGNLGGESYADRFRGPLNEGGLFFERQGYHLPAPPLRRFSRGSPFAGTDRAGIAFYAAKLHLDYSADKYDIPLSFVFDKDAAAADFRATLFVNGFQYGKYASNIGPQSDFPVPEGILNYRGGNWIGVAVWALDKGGAKVPGLRLKAGTPVLTGRERVVLVRSPAYSTRRDAY
ncbi:Beta-galactosidase [Tolypocladium paradoxum]|uniref:beta-galactosidase n=1 Tax=Tolypocladium paradoxum TaxID=94208 RepID=A0A2S4KSU7_9HYPO|nr:Beta-galactosidase [Tolypocladium paradoxum]